MMTPEQFQQIPERYDVIANVVTCFITNGGNILSGTQTCRRVSGKYTLLTRFMACDVPWQKADTGCLPLKADLQEAAANRHDILTL
jgi:hypothetical protein